MNDEKIFRYLDNLKEPALKRLAYVLLTDEQGRDFVWNQIKEFTKMYPKPKEAEE